MKRKSKFISILILTGLATGAFFYLRDTDAPTVMLSPSSGPINHRTEAGLTLTDSGMGLKSVRVVLRSNDREHILADQQFAPGQSQFKLSFKPATYKPAQGPMTIEVQAGDHAIYHLGKGNRLNTSYTLTYDSRPPAISVLSKAHNLSKGGSGLIVYTVGEEVVRTGMQVGERFFPAYAQDNGTWACLFAFPYNENPDKTIPRLIAEDAAGNIGKGSFYYRVKSVNYPRVRINLDTGFLDSIEQEFAGEFPEESDPVALFLKVNQELRKKNRARLPEIGQNTADRYLASGGFIRQQGSRTGGFGNQRSYYVKGRRIDRQTHLGIDIASTASAQVQAANDGTVVWAGPMGIYGQCIIIDHGLGLQTLYGHLSRIDVAEGQTVNKGDEIGRTGASGIAAGDHLHFGVLVAGLPVRPVEWWDGRWTQTHIEDKLKLEP